MNGNGSVWCGEIPIRLVKTVKLRSPQSSEQRPQALSKLPELLWVVS